MRNRSQINLNLMGVCFAHTLDTGELPCIFLIRTILIILNTFKRTDHNIGWQDRWIDFNDGQFSEQCDVDGSFFNSDAILIIFWKDLTSPSLRLFFLIIGNNYFLITLLILRTDYFAIIHDMPDLPDSAR